MFIDPILKEFIEALLIESPTGNLRKAQGFVREARIIKGKVSSEVFREILKSALSDLNRYNQIRVEKFRNYLQHYLKDKIELPKGDQIKRGQDNPMLRKNQIFH